MFATPEVEYKVWGKRTPIYTEDTVESYLLELHPDEGRPVACSIHHHTMKYNRFFVVSGRVVVEHGSDPDADPPFDEISSRWQLHQGESYTVPPGDLHRFVVVEPAVVVETTWADKITEDIHRRDEGHVLEDWP
jgi:mannose-6-phosphate isomerase-like protein (cupin superfamily)